MARSPEKLTPTMRFAITYTKGIGGRLVRYSGGFWAMPEWNWRDRHFSTGTIAALVTRGLAEYTAFHVGRGGSFPVEITLTTEKPQTNDATTGAKAVTIKTTEANLASEHRDFLRMMRREHAKKNSRIKYPYAAILRLVILEAVESTEGRELDPHLVY